MRPLLACLVATLAIGCSGYGGIGPDYLNCYGGGELPEGANLWTCFAQLDPSCGCDEQFAETVAAPDQQSALSCWTLELSRTSAGLGAFASIGCPSFVGVYHRAPGGKPNLWSDFTPEG